MRVTVRGWARDHGRTVLFEGTLAELQVKKAVSVFPPDEITYQSIPSTFNPSRKVAMSISSKVQVNLSGNYLLEVRLTTSDILSLFWSVFGTRTFEHIFNAFRQFRQAQEESAEEENED